MGERGREGEREGELYIWKNSLMYYLLTVTVASEEDISLSRMK